MCAYLPSMEAMWFSLHLQTFKEHEFNSGPGWGVGGGGRQLRSNVQRAMSEMGVVWKNMGDGTHGNCHRELGEGGMERVSQSGITFQLAWRRGARNFSAGVCQVEKRANGRQADLLHTKPCLWRSTWHTWKQQSSNMVGAKASREWNGGAA